MNERISLTTTAHPDEDLMIVEIDIDGENVAELLEAEGDYDVILYPKPGGGPWTMPKALLLEAIGAATTRMDKLLGRRT